MTAMSSTTTFYDILGVARNATSAQIKRAYRAKARKVHPDVNPAPDAAARFAELQNAYEVLSNPNRRREYDLSLAAAAAAAPVDPGVAGKAHYSWRNVGADATPDHADGPGGRERTELDDLYDAFFGERSG